MYLEMYIIKVGVEEDSCPVDSSAHRCCGSKGASYESLTVISADPYGKRYQRISLLRRAFEAGYEQGKAKVKDGFKELIE